MTPEQEAHLAKVSRQIAAAIIIGGVLMVGAVGAVAYLVLLDRAEILTNRTQIQGLRDSVDQIDNGKPPTEWQSSVEHQLELLWGKHGEEPPTPTD